VSDSQGEAGEGARAEDEAVQHPADQRIVEAVLVRDPWAHRRAEPRAFALFWLIYMAGSFAVALGGAGGLGLVAFDVYRQVGRTMLVLVAIGMGAVWPMVRLSQEAPPRPWRGMMQDVSVVAGPVIVLCAAQSAPWLANWPWEVALVVASTLVAWGLAVGAFVACAQVRGWAASAAMAGCIAVCGAGAAAALMVEGSEGTGVDVLNLLSAATAVLEMTGDRSWTGQNASVEAGHWLALVPPGVVFLTCVVWGLAKRRPDGREGRA